MVTSGEMHNKYQKTFQRYNTFVPWLDQKIVESFIIKGHWERHVRRIRLANKKRHDTLIHTINKTMGKNVIVHGKDAGLHVILEFRDDLYEKDLIKKAKAHGVIVYPVSTFWIRQERYKNEMILLGFSGMDESDIVQGINILNNAWFKS
jgi:GntR family transcriptional regulator / MocR family aminotransferase